MGKMKNQKSRGTEKWRNELNLNKYEKTLIGFHNSFFSVLSSLAKSSLYKLKNRKKNLFLLFKFFGH